jgi:Fic family protein
MPSVSRLKIAPLILSNDTIVRPPFEITNKILRQISQIAEKIGAAKAIRVERPSPALRKQNRVKTIRASLSIEGNTLTEEQITALLNKKRVIGPKKDILEVLNAIEAYERLGAFDPCSIESFLDAHQIMMNGLLPDAGKWRKQGVGIVKGGTLEHLAPPAENVPYLVKDLFQYLADTDDLPFVSSCVAHYEIEFIHPFLDGNGRIGRLWQTLILQRHHPIFEFSPFETIIKNRQQAYYDVLGQCDKAGQSTLFIEFMLEAIEEALDELLKTQRLPKTAQDRMVYFLASFSGNVFSRKDYLGFFREISAATASRDLQEGVNQGLLTRAGDKRVAQYTISKP